MQASGNTLNTRINGKLFFSGLISVCVVMVISCTIG
jgi:hypothetical protein